jgi:hypothetical protein
MVDPYAWLPKRGAIGLAVTEPDDLIIHFARKNLILDEMPPNYCFLGIVLQEGRSKKLQTEEIGGGGF